LLCASFGQVISALSRSSTSRVWALNFSSMHCL
jgi:hypothetical protein